MIDQIATSIAAADGSTLDADRERYYRLARAALTPLLKPSETIVGAAHEAVWFDAAWAINSRADFRKAVRAMIVAVIDENNEASR